MSFSGDTDFQNEYVAFFDISIELLRLHNFPDALFRVSESHSRNPHPQHSRRRFFSVLPTCSSVLNASNKHYLPHTVTLTAAARSSRHPESSFHTLQHKYEYPPAQDACINGERTLWPPPPSPMGIFAKDDLTVIFHSYAVRYGVANCGIMRVPA